MNDIIGELSMCANEYETSTGRKPTRFYLGKTEIQALGRFAYDRGFIDDTSNVEMKTSGERHKVLGLKIYAVDDDEPHMRACA